MKWENEMWHLNNADMKRQGDEFKSWLAHKPTPKQDFCKADSDELCYLLFWLSRRK